jgi:hypothetical protein
LLGNRLRWLFRVFWPPADKCARRSSDNVVQVADWALGWFQALLNIPFYSWQFRIARWLNKGDPWKYFNYIYGLEWALTIVILFLAARDASGGRRDLIVLVALWRAFEILTWYIKLLFAKTHRVFLEVERNLFFLIADTVVFVTALALLLETGNDGAAFAKWSDGFSAFTLNGTPDRYNSPLATLVGVLGAVGGLALLAAGLGIVINLNWRTDRGSPRRRAAIYGSNTPSSTPAKKKSLTLSRPHSTTASAHRGSCSAPSRPDHTIALRLSNSEFFGARPRG